MEKPYFGKKSESATMTPYGGWGGRGDIDHVELFYVFCTFGHYWNRVGSGGVIGLLIRGDRDINSVRY
ncbi:hypothetical protein GCM10009069_27580 [Algimonas arctica]|uniref:Uncharacterized protein n=1 Tax=Algimonas arctica TaxID=1479486 RepID=A0A8J3G3N0_9PROT|nr:hypothetical protein GCM10009069_27580 [Algimonas arctica]